MAVNIDPLTGLRELSGASRTIEYFYQESQPPVGEEGAFARGGRPQEEVRDQIF